MTVQSRLLEGVKKEYLTPKTVKKLSNRVQARLRKIPPPNHRIGEASLNRLEKQIRDVIDTLITVGKSEALTQRLCELERDKDNLRARLQFEQRPPTIVPNVSKIVSEQVETLERIADSPYAIDADRQRTRDALHNLLGTVTIIEERGGVFAQIDLGRIGNPFYQNRDSGVRSPFIAQLAGAIVSPALDGALAQ